MELWRSLLVLLRCKLIALTASVNKSAVAQHPGSLIRRFNSFINHRRMKTTISIATQS
jgi:hypothetical protein